MADKSRVWICSIFLALFVFSSISSVRAEDEGESEEEPSSVVTLDASNFDEAIAKHPFIVVEFYAPWCGYCKKLAPEYEKAASLLSKHDPPVILAKVDANEEANKELANKYEVKGLPTIKIFRNEGKNIQEYKGPREADGIVEYLKKQVGPASSEIKSSEDADNIITEKKVIIVGVFPEFSGQEFENFLAVAEKLRSDYEFSHVLDAKLLPRGDSSVKGPIVRLFKPFDELFVDYQDFHVEALEKFIEVASVPIVTTFNKDPGNHPYVTKFFNSDSAKAMLFLNFSGEHFDALKAKYQEVASNYRGKGVTFLIGDLDASQGAFQEGSLKPFRKSEPIPEVNNEPVKVVVADNLHDVVNSGKNVLLEFYAPWCGHCKKLAPILDEVALSLEKDTDVVIAKMDATANDVPNDYDVRGYPTLYFSSANGKVVQYEGGRSAEDIINFINQHKDTAGRSDSPVQDIPVQAEPVKDEL